MAKKSRVHSRQGGNPAGPQDQAILRNVSAANPANLALAFQQAAALHQAGRLAEAEHIYDQILKFQPKHFESRFLLGVIHSQRGNYPDAIRQFDVALRLNPNNASVHNSRGVALGKLKRVTEALASFDRAIALQPNDAEIEAVKADVRDGKPATTPFALLAESGAARDQLLCAQGWVREKCPAAPAAIYKGEKYRHERIRVAYVSADFGEHPTSYLLAGLIEDHDRSRFKILGVSLGSGT